MAFPGALIATEFIGRLVEFDESADEQIEAAVIVVVEPDGAGGPSRRGDAGFKGDVGKGSVAIVAIEGGPVIAGDKEVGITVSVVVANGDAHAVTGIGHPCLGGDVGEGSVAVVAVKPIAQRLLRSEEVAGTAVDEEDVHPAVVVKIEKRTAGPRGFGQVIGRRSSIGMFPGDAGLGGGNRLKEG